MQKVFKQKSQQIAKMYINGESSLSISEKMSIPVRTVITHLHINNLKIRSQREALLLALKKNRLKVRLTQIPKQPKNLTESKAYILGVLCGDGWIYYNNISPKQTYQVGLQAVDKDFVDKFSNCVYKVYGLKPKKRIRKSRHIDWQDQFESKLCSKKVCDDLIVIGAFKTKTWRVPSTVILSKPKIKSAFLMGFFDSEGNVDKRSRRITGASVNCVGLQGINNLLKSLDIRNKIRKNKEGCYYICIEDRKSVENFARWIKFSIKYKDQNLKDILDSYQFYKAIPAEVEQIVPQMRKLRERGQTYLSISKIFDISEVTVWRRLNSLRDPTRLTP